MKLMGNRAIVTGGAQGIGRGIVERLLEHGADVAILDLDEALAEQTAAELRPQHPERTVSALGADIRKKDAIEAALDELEPNGPVDILVNCAGTAILTPIVDIGEDEWDMVLDVNLKGTFLTTQAVAKRLLAADAPGSIVNISSLNALAGTDGLAHYSAAKAGVSMFTQVAAAEFGRHGIRVNAVAPGTTRTPLTESIGTVSGLMGDEFIARTPLGRLGVPDDLAKAVVFLCSDYAEWVTGVTLSVDGGNHIRGLHSYWDVWQTQLSEGGGESAG